MFYVKNNHFEWRHSKKKHSGQKHLDKANSFTLKHFQEVGDPRLTWCKILKRKEDGFSAERQKGSGRPAKIMTKSGTKQLVRLLDHKRGIIQRIVPTIHAASS